jgi:hypothetical protein
VPDADTQRAADREPEDDAESHSVAEGDSDTADDAQPGRLPDPQPFEVT